MYANSLKYLFMTFFYWERKGNFKGASTVFKAYGNNWIYHSRSLLEREYKKI